MGLRDRLLGTRGGDRDGQADGMGSDAGYDAAAGAGLTGTAELAEFAPRQDGDYRCVSRGLYLRFARPIVTETVTGPAADGSELAEPARGEFTTSGRFTVQRRFGRAIVYTVLSGGGNDAVLVVRRTDTAGRQAERLEFVFESDEA